MRLTFLNRLKICWEVLTTRSGHAHTSHEKQLSIFQTGYSAGVLDCELEKDKNNHDADVIEAMITYFRNHEILGDGVNTRIGIMAMYQYADRLRDTKG